MAQIGEGLWFELDLDDKKFNDKIKDVKTQVESLSKKIDLNLDASKIDKDLEKIFKKTRNVTLGFDKASVSANFQKILDKSINGAAKVGVDKRYLLDSIRNALENQTFTIHVKARGTGDNSVIVNDVDKLNEKLKKTGEEASGLQDKLLKAFSIDTIRRFLTEIVKVGGEIEKQKLALGSIVGDTSLADTLYGKISNLSMISPFDVEDLMKYSKQLSAFGIQYNDLYDTTKRLADIAAGVGVDFGRIAYEFGQTSARGHLDARELRMFANSGIPLLRKLSDYYSKIQGTRITSAQVRGMITNREVSFEDVKNVLWDMTNAGGEFYQMQEVMAESLAAKWRNLGNAWNLMLANMAEGGIGKVLKEVADALTFLTKNYESFAAALVFGGAIAKMWSNSLKVMGAESFYAATAGEKLRNSFTGLGGAFKNLMKTTVANPFFWITAVVASTAAWIAHLVKARREINAISEATKEAATQGLNNLNQTLDVHSIENIGKMNTSQIQDGIKELKEELKKYDPLWKSTFAKTFETTKDGTKYIKDLNEQYAILIERLEMVKKGYEEMSDHPDLGMQMDKNSGGFWWDDSYSENATKAAKAFADLNSHVFTSITKDARLAESSLNAYIQNLENNNSNLKADKYWQQTLEDIKEATTLGDKYAALIKFVGDRDFVGDLNITETNTFFSTLARFDKYRSRMAEDSQSMYNTLVQQIVMADKSIDESVKKNDAAIRQYLQNLPEEKKISIIAEFNKILDKAGVTDETLREMFSRDVLVKQLHYQISYDYEDKNLDILNAYQNQVMSALPEVKDKDERGNLLRTQEELSAEEQAIKNIENIIRKNKDAVELADALQKKYDGIIQDQRQYTGQLLKKNARAVTEDDLKKAEAEYKRYVEINKYERKYAEEAAQAGGIRLKEKGANNGRTNAKDPELERLKNEYQQYKTIWQDFKMLSEKYGTEDSWNMIFGSEAWNRVDKLKGVENKKGFLAVAEQFQADIDDLLKGATTNDNNREARKQFWQTIFKDVIGMDNDILKPEIDAALQAIEKEFSDAKEKYDFNKAIFDVTGADEYAGTYSSAIATILRSKLKKEFQDMDLKELMGKSEDEIVSYLVNPADKKAVKKGADELSKAYKDEAKQVRDALVNAFKSTQTAQEKLVTVTKTWEENIARGLAEGTITVEQEAAMWKAAFKEIGEATLDSLKSQDNPLGNLFSDKIKANSIKFISSLKKVRQLIDYINGKNENRPSWITQEEVENLRRSPEALAEISSQMNKISNVWDSLGSSGLGGLLGGIGGIFSHSSNAKKAREELKNLTKGTDAYKKKLAEAEDEESKMANSMYSAFQGAADVIGEVGQQIGKLADATNNENLKEMAQNLQDMSSIISSTASGAASGGWVGAIIGFVTSTASAITNSVIQAKAMAYEYRQFLKDWQNSLTMLDLTLDESKFENAFGTNKIALAVDAYNKMILAAEKYNETVNNTSIAPTAWLGESASNTWEKWLSLSNSERQAIQKKYAGKVMSDLQGYLVKVGSKGALFWKEGVYERLFDIAPEMWNNERDGEFNVDAAKKFLETNTQISEELRKQIQYAIDLAEAEEKANEAIKSLLGEWYGDWSSSLTDAIFDGILNGTSAWDAFEKAGAEAVLKIGKEMLNSTVFNAFFSDYEDKLASAFKGDDPIPQILDITSEMYNKLPQAFDAANSMAESYIKAAEEYGFNFDSLKGQSSGLSTSIKGITEETADILAALLNGVRADVSVQRELMSEIAYVQLPQISVIAESQLTQLNMIAENTLATANNTAACREYAEMSYDIFNSITTGMKKVSIA